MQFFSRNCTHILTRPQGKKFEYMFLVKIASKGTSLKSYSNTQNHITYNGKVRYLYFCRFTPQISFSNRNLNKGNWSIQTFINCFRYRHFLFNTMQSRPASTRRNFYNGDRMKCYDTNV